MRDETVDARLARNRAWRKAYKEKRRALGLCNSCASPARPNLTECGACAERGANAKRARRATQKPRVRVESNRTYKARRKAKGLCNDCSALAIPGRTNCAACAAAKRVKTRAKCIPRIASVEARIRSKRRRRALGLCNDCAEPALRSTSRCEKCAADHRRRERLAIKYGRPDYLAHLHEDLPLWQRALLARGQAVHLRKFRKAS
jgi:hypothetical protein